ncbi:hypothetical protein CDAR_96231 [Caerostris darwini]|uniref:Uncharacterized protein n=1 Tax=Caerostris darwini TaxID=1538125 RepID=A0AAV4TNU3_9ARAC|nr:hypothetical protein CDAR_96231 [Caerostris darwini]
MPQTTLYEYIFALYVDLKTFQPVSHVYMSGKVAELSCHHTYRSDMSENTYFHHEGSIKFALATTFFCLLVLGCIGEFSSRKLVARGSFALKVADYASKQKEKSISSNGFKCIGVFPKV